LGAGATGSTKSLRIDPAHRPAGLEHVATYHPTFLYESLWNLAVVGVILLVERGHRLRSGRLFAVYVAGYALGRFFIERLRIDYAHTIAGLRVHEWVMSLLLFVAAAVAVAAGRVTEPDATDHDPDRTSTPSTSHAPLPSPEAERSEPTDCVARRRPPDGRLLPHLGDANGRTLPSHRPAPLHVGHSQPCNG
jgi:hypothetical protein